VTEHGREFLGGGRRQPPVGRDGDIGSFGLILDGPGKVQFIVEENTDFPQFGNRSPESLGESLANVVSHGILIDSNPAPQQEIHRPRKPPVEGLAYDTVLEPSPAGVENSEPADRTFPKENRITVGRPNGQKHTGTSRK
jgi:hypothetical protein